jgi:hypothetical protein
MRTRWGLAVLVGIGLGTCGAIGQTSPTTQGTQTATTSPASRPSDVAPDLKALVGVKESELSTLRLRYEADRRNLTQFYDVVSSPTRQKRLVRFDSQWLSAVKKLDAASLSKEGAAERERLIGTIESSLKELAQQKQMQGEIATVVPFAAGLTGLEEAWRRMEPVDGKHAAEVMDQSARQITKLKTAIEVAAKDS